MNTLPYQRILTSINLLIENSKEMQDNKYVQEDMSRNLMHTGRHNLRYSQYVLLLD